MENNNKSNDIYKLAYHMIPPKGWMNDPNGLIHYKGEYHLFYQYHPYSAKYGPMHWGHAKSTDLVHWQHLPIALTPSEKYDRDGCWSGSAIEDNGILKLFYSGNITKYDKLNRKNINRQLQCGAASADGITFRKFQENPIIEEAPIDGSNDFRDPKVWFHKDAWYMIVGSCKDGIGRVLLYKSKDLHRWSYIGVMAQSDGTQGTMWECPDLFQIGNKYILILSPMGMEGHKNIYMIGQIDYDRGKFTCEYYDELDFGPDFYAAQTFLDDNGRRILIGWMNMWNTQMPTQSYGWAGAMTMSRELSISPKGKLYMSPVPEYEMLRDQHFRLENICLQPRSSNILKGICGDCMEINAAFKLPSGDNRLDPNNDISFGIRLRCSSDGSQYTDVGYNAATKILYVDRNKSGIGDKGLCSCSLQSYEGLIKMRIFLDKSSLEVFANDGEKVLSARIYPDLSSTGLEVFTNGGLIDLLSIDIWSMKSIW